MNKVKLLYEKFHNQKKMHRKIIDDNDFTYSNILPVIKKYIKKDSEVLDVGCGSGTLDFYLSDKVKNILGIDISSLAIKSCNENAKRFNLNNIKYIESTLEKFKTNRKFNIILLLEVIEHLEKEKFALNKLNKLLKRDGVLILSTPSINAPLFKMGLLNKFDDRVGHLRRYDYPMLDNLLNNCNFKIVKCIKNEGLIRNLIFTNSFFGLLLKIINRSNFLGHLTTKLDKITQLLFGESDFIIVAKKK